MPNNQQVFYIGMQDQWFTFNMFDAQAWYARDVILGRIKLPDAATMAAEWSKWRAAEEAIAATDEANIRYQAEYTKRLIEQTDYKMFDIEGLYYYVIMSPVSPFIHVDYALTVSYRA